MPRVRDTPSSPTRFGDERRTLTENSAASVAFALLKNGGSALDAVEMAIKVFEDREITNAGYGSNLCMDGTVECDSSIVDHHGRSGAAGAVSNIKNPIGLARLILNESSRPLSLDRVPPNLLVGAGATAYAQEKGLLTVFNDYMVSKGAKERWFKWKTELAQAQEDDITDGIQHTSRESTCHSDQTLANQLSVGSQSEISPPISPPSIRGASVRAHELSFHPPLVAPTADANDTYPESRGKANGTDLGVQAPTLAYSAEVSKTERTSNIDGKTAADVSGVAVDDRQFRLSKRQRLSGSNNGPLDKSRPTLGKLANFEPQATHKSGETGSAPNLQPLTPDDDRIVDTVGAIAVDCYGNIAAGSSSGGIGMKYRGRCGPAALVGIGTAVVPVDPEDPDETSVATVTSGTGEHMATTLAAATCADRIYSSVRKVPGSQLESCTEDQAIRSVILRDFMGHPGVKNSPCDGGIGIMTVKKTRHGIMLLFGHNTDSFVLASMQSFDRKPTSVMSRNGRHKSIAQGGRIARYPGNGSRP